MPRSATRFSRAICAPPGRPQAIDLIGCAYRPGRQSLVVSYQAGYAVQRETQSVPLSTPFQLAAFAPYGPWASDLGVAYAATGVLSRCRQHPRSRSICGQRRRILVFLSRRRATRVAFLGYIPQDVAQAALELAAERFRAAERNGLRSKSVGGQETISYDGSAVSAPVLAMLQPYKRVAV